MLKRIAERRLPSPLGRRTEEALLRKLEGRLLDVEEGNEQSQNIQILNDAIKETFEDFGVRVAYSGVYGVVNPRNHHINPIHPEKSYTFDKPGCTDIRIHWGTISSAITNRESIYVPSILDAEEQDPGSHHECRQGNDGTNRKDMAEIVVAYRQELPDGRVAVQRTHDLDVFRVNVLSDRGFTEYSAMVESALRVCFPEPIDYEVEDGHHARPPEDSDFYLYH